jgi:hypothetical protein
MLARDLEERFSTTAAARYAMLVTCPSAALVDRPALAQLAAAHAGDTASADRSDASAEHTVPARPSAKSG